jgi:hypothetical protein
LNRVDVNEVKNTTTEAIAMQPSNPNHSFFNNGNPPSNTQGGKKMQLTNDDLCALVTEFRDKVDELLAKPTQAVPATLTVVGEDGKRMHFGLQFDEQNEHRSKQGVMQIVAQLVARQGIVPAAVVMVAEAWTAPSYWSGMPAKCPARELNVIVAVTAADLRTMMASLRVAKDAEDNLVARNWMPTASVPAPLLKEFYFAYDAAVIGGSCSKKCPAFNKEFFQKSLTESLGEDQPQFLLPAEANGAVIVQDAGPYGRCMEVIWLQPGLSEEEQRLFNQDLSKHWGRKKGCQLSLEKFADMVAQATEAGAVDGAVAIWVPQKRQFLALGQLNPRN